jgi:hypothetical protein
MSYCRFSSDDWKSDIYCCETVDDTFMVVIAEVRINGAERTPIGLPHDGESRVYKTAGECANGLEALRALGYHVPQHAIDRLREEAKCSSAV